MGKTTLKTESLTILIYSPYCVGEWIGDDMIKYRNGNILKWSWSIPNRVSYSMDTKISAPYPKSWHKRIPDQTFSEDYERYAGMRNNRI